MERYLFVIIFCCASIFAQVDTTFSGLRGYEDLEGHTQLFYRMKSDWVEPRNEFEYIGEHRNDIFHYDIIENIDSLFLIDGVKIYTPFPSNGQRVTDFEFIDSTLTNFYQCGDAYTSFEPGPIVVYNRDYDHPFGVESFHGTTYNLEITSFDNNINVYVYADGSPSGIFSISEYGNFELIESTEGFRLISINNSSPNEWFVEDDNGYLYKSVDTGKTFNIVDSSIVDIYSNYFYFEVDYLNRYFFYDTDSLHIYRIIKDENKYQLSISNNKGKINSWERKFESSKEIFISVDPSTSGNVFIATDKQIYHSDDHGQTFSLYRELKNKIVGIYKKPNSDLIYITTHHSLLEVNPDTVKVLKQLINYNTFIYNPLQIGDKWIYDIKRIDYDEDFYPNERNYQSTREVVKDTILNGKKYFEVKEILSDRDSIKYTYLRNDSLDGKVYQYEESSESNEFVKEDLNIEMDQYFNTWINYSDGLYEVEVYFLGSFNYEIFDTNSIAKFSRKYELNGPYISEYYLSKDIGKSYEYKGIVDGFDEYCFLKAAYINGEIYGDTTLVSVEKNTELLPTNFSLEQNYPNPFNPSTTIKYSLPFVERKSSFAQATTGLNKSQSGDRLYNVTLKVYDILGREITTLVNKEQRPGNYKVQFNAEELTSGIYFYRLQYGSFTQSRKMILLR